MPDAREQAEREVRRDPSMGACPFCGAAKFGGMQAVGVTSWTCGTSGTATSYKAGVGVLSWRDLSQSLACHQEQWNG